MNMKKFVFLIMFAVAACTGYQSPEREEWPNILYGASFTDMNADSIAAKKPIFLGDDGRRVSDAVKVSADMEYGDKAQNENAMYIGYMANLENALYDALRRPGLSVQRVGTDVTVIMVRDAIIQLNAPDISPIGDEKLKTVAEILKQYDATFIEIAGYTDSMRDTAAARALSLDMAQRVAVYLAQAGVKTTRMFIIGRGAARPIAAQDEWGRLANRRVELRITPVR